MCDRSTNQQTYSIYDEYVKTIAKKSYLMIGFISMETCNIGIF